MSHICKMSLTGLHDFCDFMASVHSPFSFGFLDPFLDFNKLDVGCKQAGCRSLTCWMSDVGCRILTSRMSDFF